MREHENKDSFFDGIRRRDHDAFTSVYQRYRLKIFRYCSGLLSGDARANDAVQETFLKLYKAAPSFTREAALKTWLYTVARNEVRMVWRRDRHRVDDDMVTIAAQETTVSELDRQETTFAIWEALGKLSPEHREMLVLREFEDMSYDEIARIMQLSLTAVKSRIFKARRALAAKLAPMMEERGAP